MNVEPAVPLAFLLMAPACVANQSGPLATLTPFDSAFAPTEQAPITRFVALGDGGEGNETQFAVADAVRAVCDALGCDFAVYLGDNFYDSGVVSVDDPQWDTKFELPYAELDFPFFAALGNHDNGADGLGTRRWRGDAQVAYANSGKSDKFTMPARQYGVLPSDGMALVVLDTNDLMFGLDAREQGELVDGFFADLDPDRVRVVAGHHPYVSNGRHGNAGAYEGLPWLPVVSGAGVRTFMEAHVCGQADLYLAGHDHTLQWLAPTCGTHFVVSGAAAKTTDLAGWGTPTLFETDETAGFFWFELVGRRLLGRAYDRDGEVLFEHRVAL